MPGQGRRFTSETGRRAIKRKRGLKAWRTRLAASEPELLYGLLERLRVYANAFKRLKHALELLKGERVIRCSCSGCVAVQYGANASLIEAELRRLKAELDVDLRKLRHQEHEAALAKARAEDGTGL